MLLDRMAGKDPAVGKAPKDLAAAPGLGLEPLHVPATLPQPMAMAVDPSHAHSAAGASAGAGSGVLPTVAPLSALASLSQTLSAVPVPFASASS